VRNVGERKQRVCRSLISEKASAEVADCYPLNNYDIKEITIRITLSPEIIRVYCAEKIYCESSLVLPPRLYILN
jgi:hypothetical protein